MSGLANHSNLCMPVLPRFLLRSRIGKCLALFSKHLLHRGVTTSNVHPVVLAIHENYRDAGFADFGDGEGSVCCVIGRRTAVWFQVLAADALDSSDERAAGESSRR